MPNRIQRKRTKGFNLKAASSNPNGVVYVGRPTRWGNPLIVGEKVISCLVAHGWPGPVPETVAPLTIVTRDNIIPIFEELARARLAVEPDWLEPLRDKDPACWCKEGAPCHADPLLRLANVVTPLPQSAAA